jgi:TPR repeat protein
MSENPEADMAKAQKLMEIDARYVAVIPRVMPGQVDQAVIDELRDVLEGYRRLHEEGAPTFAFYTLDDLVGKMANTTEFIARAHETLTDLEQAEVHYEQAAKLFDSVGRHDEAERCRTTIARAQLAATGDVDADVRRLRGVLDRLSEPSLERVGVMVELGELTSKAGDDFEAASLLRQALEELQGLGLEEPQAEDMAASLEATLRSIDDGTARPGETEVERVILVHGLYLRLYMALAQAARETDPEEARRYQGRAQALHGGKEFAAEAVQRLMERFGAIGGLRAD